MSKGETDAVEGLARAIEEAMHEPDRLAVARAALAYLVEHFEQEAAATPNLTAAHYPRWTASALRYLLLPPEGPSP